MIRKIISGGQTGVDRGALDAAIELGIPHGGWCPRGRRSEYGPIPERYQLQEMPTDSYPKRTAKNVEKADATLVISHGALTPGTALTLRMLRRNALPHFWIDLAAEAPHYWRDGKGIPRTTHAEIIRDWLEHEPIATLNVAGSRESSRPGIQEQTRALLVEVLRR